MASGTQQHVAFSFPLLKRNEILGILNDLRIPITEDDLREPSATSMRFLYENFVELIVGINKEDLAQPQFEAAAMLEYPELHNESLSEFVFSSALQRLMQICGIKDFSMNDVLKPDQNRTRTILSALINFTKFREEHLVHYQDLVAETDQLHDRMQQLEETTQHLASQVRMIRAQREDEQPAVDEVHKQVDVLEVEINTLNKLQAQLHGESRKIKDEITAQADQAANLKFSIENARQDCARLRSQIVPAPDKLKKEIVDMNASLVHEKELRANADRRARDMSAKLEALNKAQLDMRKATALLEDVGAQMGKHRETLREIDNTQEGIQVQQRRAAELSAKEQHVRKQLAQMQERHSRLLHQQDMKREAAGQAVDTMRQEREAVENERQNAMAKMEKNATYIKELNEKRTQVLQAHATEIQNIHVLHMQLFNQVGEYHQKLLDSIDGSVE